MNQRCQLLAPFWHQIASVAATVFWPDGTPLLLPQLSTLTVRPGRTHVTLEWEEGEWPCVDGYDIRMSESATGDVVDKAFEFSQVGKMTVATVQGLKSCTTYEVRMESTLPQSELGKIT